MEKLTEQGGNPVQQAFGSLAGAVVGAMESFFRSFRFAVKGIDQAVTPEILLNLLVVADQFSNDASDRLSGVIREHSPDSGLRDSSDGTLARLVRARCFETLDTLLIQYVDTLSAMEIDLKPMLNRLGKSVVREYVEDLCAGTASKRFRLPGSGKAVALVGFSNYLQELARLPHSLLDYGGAKLFSANVDVEMQGRYLRTIEASVHESLQATVGLIEGLEMVKTKRWEQESARESATIGAVAAIASMKQDTQKTSWGYLLAGLALSAPLGWVVATQSTHPYVLGGAVSAACVSAFLVYKSFVSFIRS